MFGVAMEIILRKLLLKEWQKVTLVEQKRDDVAMACGRFLRGQLLDAQS